MSVRAKIDRAIDVIADVSVIVILSAIGIVAGLAIVS